jgi:hypothetical protein
VTDFEAGDLLKIQSGINGSGIEGFGDLTISQNSEADAIIELGEDASITLKGVSPNSLSESDFSFF